MLLRRSKLVVIDHGEINQIPSDLLNKVFEKYTEPTAWYDSVLIKEISVFVLIVTLITLLVGWYFFLRGYRLPYVIRYWFLSFTNIFRKVGKYEYLNCVHHSTPVENLFRGQRFIYKIDKILWNFRLIDKVNSEGTRAWIKSGQIPTTDILQEIDALAENFNESQKSQYGILKETWNPILGLTVDKEIVLVYIHSVITLAGITLREWLLDDDFLILLKLVETRSAKSRSEFGEKETERLINLLKTLLPEKAKSNFLDLVEGVFQDNFALCNSKKNQFVSIFCYFRIEGGSRNDYTI